MPCQHPAAPGSTRERDRNDFLVFNTSNHTLHYDRDGSGGAKAVKLAVLKNKVSLRNTDFVLS